MRKRLTTLLCLVAACGGASSSAKRAGAPGSGAKPGAPLPAPTFRLDGKVVPKAYALDLDIDPTADGYDGVIDIDIELAQPAESIWLSGAELVVREATLSVAGAEPFPLTILPPPAGDDPLFVGFSFGRVVPAGPARLHILFRGKLQTNETLGAFKQKEGNDWYVFTQFETADASRAFPCFDEPQWKTPWSVTLRVPAGDLAFANTPVAREEPLAGGRKAVTFVTTKPLPSYLVAFAVGPFAVVSARPTRSGTPIRILTPKGREGEAAYAAEVTPRLVETLEDYFGIPYPFEKLDSIAIPHTIAFGAMENPGLITYNHEILLSRPSAETLGWRQLYASVGAHEIAHMWFGDLVTLAWWDDTWLNESFASWAASMVVGELAPEWGEEVERVASRSKTLGLDASPAARPIRVKVDNVDDMVTAFDYTAYEKGQAVLEMFESWLGPEVFRKGVSAYLHKYSYGSASAADFFAAIGAAAKRDVAPVLASFVEQPGVPLVEAQLSCEAGAAPKLLLSQVRYRFPGTPADEQVWKIPVCARFEAGGKAGRACTVLEGSRGALALPAASCPDWVYPNAEGAGYYRAALAGDLRARVDRVLGSKLTRSERVAYLGDVAALVQNGAIPAADALALVARIAPASDWRLAQAANLLLGPVSDALVEPAQRAAYGRYVAKLYGARARALGMRVKAGESTDVLELRGEILVPAAIDGRDARLAAEARALAARWLGDRKAVHPELVDEVLEIAAATADRPLFERLRDAARTLPDASDRSHLIDALGAVRNPAFVDGVLGLLLDDKLDVREALGLFYALNQNPERAVTDAAYEYVKAHQEAIVARLPRPAQTAVFSPAGAFCDEKRLSDFRSDWAERAGRMLNGKRAFEKKVAAIQTCIALRKAQQASVARFLLGV